MAIETTSLLPDAIAVSLDIVSQESLAEKIISVESMGVLLGVLVGGIVTFGAQYFVDKRHAKARKKALSAAFFGEIYALLSLAEEREYLEKYFREYLRLEVAKDYPVFDTYLQMQFDAYFTVYKANVSEIGHLDSDIIPLITDFYLKIFSILEDMTKIPNAKWKLVHQQGVTLEKEKCKYISLLKEMLPQNLRLFMETIDKGKYICETLSNRYDLKYTPVLGHVKSYEEFMLDTYPNCFIPAYQADYKNDFLCDDEATWELYEKSMDCTLHHVNQTATTQ